MSPSITLRAAAACLAIAAAAPVSAASFYAYTSACASYQPSCEFGSTQQTVPGGAPATSNISRSYTFVPPAGSGGGWSVGVNSAVTFEAPTAWRAYSQAGGFANIQDPFALNALNFSTAATIGFSETFTAPVTPTWTGTGSLRFSFLVDGDVSVSYSAPGTPDQASVAAALGFSCSKTVAIGPGFATSPCTSPDFAAAPPGSFTLNGARALQSSQAFSEQFDFDVFVQPGQTFTLNLTTALTAGMGYVYGTPVGVLNGLVAADFQNTGRLVAVTLFDAAGNVVPDAQLVSGSGFDYLAISQVPAPSALPLLLTALGVVAGRAGWRRRRG